MVRLKAEEHKFQVAVFEVRLNPTMVRLKADYLEDPAGFINESQSHYGSIKS